MIYESLDEYKNDRRSWLCYFFGHKFHQPLPELNAITEDSQCARCKKPVVWHDKEKDKHYYIHNGRKRWLS